jgi:hypothetical protein
VPDHAHTASDIRTFLASADRTRTDDLAQTAADYAALCREANGRLRRCREYLRRGMRSAAIHLAECPPDLLEQVGALDLPEPSLHDWEEVCASYGLARPVRVMIEAAQEVNEAYAHARPIEDLLSRHRLLALAKAPLRDRLAVLRHLAKRDARSPAWDEDARALERARLAEITAEAVAAIRAKDAAKVDALLDELREPGWRTPVPKDLRTRIETAAATLHREHAAGDLWALVPRVRSAVSSGLYDQCQQVLADWCAVVQRSGVVLPKELRDEIRPLNELIDREDERRDNEHRFDEACRELRRAVESGAAGPEVRELYRVACGYQQSIPDDLATTYRRRIDAHERAERKESRRNLMLTVVLVAMVALALAGLIGVMVTFRGQ